MKELALKYGCNPNQKPSRIYMDDGRELPIEVINGRPGYINFLDAFNSWQLVRELNESGRTLLQPDVALALSREVMGAPAAAKAAKATGGVASAMTPKYRQNRCTATKGTAKPCAALRL